MALKFDWNLNSIINFIMTSLQLINAQADVVRKAAALGININAAKGLQEVLKTNLGPKGTIKM
jgi:T-complex protein 1 subunit zeta